MIATITKQLLFNKSHKGVRFCRYNNAKSYTVYEVTEDGKTSYEVTQYVNGNQTGQTKMPLNFYLTFSKCFLPQTEVKRLGLQK